MALSKKKISAQELGNIIYTNIRYGVMSPDTPLSHSTLMEKISGEGDVVEYIE